MQLNKIEKINLEVKLDIPNILLMIFSICVLLSNLTPIPGLFGNALIAGCGCLLFIYTILYKKDDKRIWWVVLLAIMLSFCLILSSMYNHNASIKEVLWIWSYMGAALALVSFEIDSRWVSVLFYVLAGYFFLCIIMRRSVHYILYSTSRNGISLLMIFMALLLYICRKSNQMKIVYLPATFNLIISVWALGRAGILTAVLFWCGIVIYGLVVGKGKNCKELLGNIGLLVIAIFLLVGVFPTNESLYLEKKNTIEMDSASINKKIEQNIPENKNGMVQSKNETFISRFSEYGLKSVRINIWSEYLEKTLDSGKNFFLGVDCSTGKYLGTYKQPHNSYLELHAKFGIIGFIIVMTLLIKTFFLLYREREWLWLIIFVTCAIRAMLDWVAFPGSIDVIFWFLILKNILMKRESKKLHLKKV